MCSLRSGIRSLVLRARNGFSARSSIACCPCRTPRWAQRPMQLKHLLESLGEKQRWRTHPRLVLLFRLVLTGMAVISLGLVATQVFLLHTYCALCLCSAIISWANTCLSWDE